ncbi:hypothetical protein [Pseudomonas sp.]|uniref:hypothetical protein n=1 Tax=Pseudomonas sp. TaxID=306 RepID=UPI003FD8E2E2
MKTTHLIPITEEQRAAAKIRKSIDQDRARLNFKVDYADHQYWIMLATKYNCRLPLWWQPSSEFKYLRRVAKKANFDIRLFVESTGCSNIKEYVSINSHLSAIGVVGPLLECIDEYFTNPPVFTPDKPSMPRKKRTW